MKKCKKLRLKIEKKKEVEELDLDNIIAESGELFQTEQIYLTEHKIEIEVHHTVLWTGLGNYKCIVVHCMRDFDTKNLTCHFSGVGIMALSCNFAAI